MRHALLLIATLLATALTAADAPKLWGNLEPGRYRAGFRVLERYDSARPFRFGLDLAGKPRGGALGRPMQISVWYPTDASAPRMRFGDYLGLVATETRFGAHTADETSAAETRFFAAFIELRGLTPEQRERWRSMETYAIRDAKPAAGKFPLIVWSFFSPAIGHVTPELLASHGYVVATLPRVPSTIGAADRDAMDLEVKSRDFDFLLNELASDPSADLRSVGVVGFSAGGRWGLVEAMRNPPVRALVSLDSVMLYNDAGGQAMSAHPQFDADAVRIPILHMIRAEWVPNEDPKRWEALRYADRTYFDFTDPALEHLDFQSSGYAATVAGGRGAKAASVATAFHDFNRWTLAFFDAHLKNDAKARAFLAGPPPANVKAAHLAALPAPLSPAEFLQATQEDGLDAAITAYRAARASGASAIAENTLNSAAYQLLLGQRRAADAARLFELNVEAYPDSANAHDSLGDAYDAMGDAPRAIAEAEKAIALLEKDPSPADRKEAIRASAQEKVGRLKK